MSGILGLWNLDGRPIERPELARLSATLAHRGPDGEGFHVHGSVGLACRLSRITPEAIGETQPLLDRSGSAIVFDGRLDNRDELLKALGAGSQLSADASDPEIVLGTYRRFGEDFAARLNGDFALAVFDSPRRRLLLARDVVGLRTLYYYASREIFLFASEIKTLLAHPQAQSRPADAVLADLFFNKLTTEDTRGVTFFENLFSVLPAHLLVVTPDTLTIRRYWDFDPARQIRFGSHEEYTDAFRDVFTQAIRRRLRSALPVAVSVSGGLDSSAILCVAEQIRRSDAGVCPPVIAASHIAPEGSPADEKAFLLDIERQYPGLTIERFAGLPSGVMTAAQEAVWHAEAPLLDAQGNSSHAFFGAVRALGARVMMTGHWGDQFLFDSAYLVDLCLRGAWRQAWAHAGEYGCWVGVADRGLFKRRLARDLATELLPQAIAQAIRRLAQLVRSVPAYQGWYTDVFRTRKGKAGIHRFTGGRAAGSASSAHARSLYREVRSRYHVLCMEWNAKIGAMYGLEMAFPFLDRDLIAFLMAIPGEVQNRNGVPKAILRDGLRGVLPDAIASRASKADFTSIVNEGMAREFDEIPRHVHAGSLAATLGYIRPDTMARDLARIKSQILGEHALVSGGLMDLVALELWLQQFFGRNV